MLKLLARVVAKPGKEEETKTALEAMLQPTHQEAGCIRYDLFQAAENAREFWFIEEWSSNEALERHKQTAHYLRLVETLLALAENVELVALDPIE